MPLVLPLIRRPAFGLAILLLAFGAWAAADWYVTAPPDALDEAHYVGRATCARCHQAEAEAWAGSDHDRAMEVATDETVEGDFNNAEFEHFGERTRFFRDGKKFMVNAEGPDGEYRDYEIKYTFGVRPLQQYMVEFPDGRMQVLRASWDTEKKEWFYVAPPDAENERINAGDPLHWTGLAQNWNTMCADCHSTDFHKNFDLAANKYNSKYFEIDVSCEACHGPGGLHVELAEKRSLFWDRKVRYGLTNSLKNATSERQVETCAPCHSRRSVIHDGYRAGDAFADHFDPVLLVSGLYYSDGQIRDEVYDYGSFTQSKMYHEGVKCSDCHNPHSLSLRYEGNRLCAQCHQPGKYDTPAHHHHTKAAPGAEETQCVTCHMPSRVYMGIDDRRDHSIRVPRPDLTVTLDTPNVCNRCHTRREEDAKWAADAVVKWYGAKRPDDPHYAPALTAAQRGDEDGGELLEQLLGRREVPDIVRATAIDLLSGYSSPASARLRREALDDPNPLVRAAAVRGATSDSTARLIREVAPKLDDPVLSVRMAAATRLVEAAPELANTQFQAALDTAVADYRRSQSLHLDRADAHMSLASLSSTLGDYAAAARSLRMAIRQEPYRTGPRSMLSQLLAQLAADPTHKSLAAELGGSDEEIRKLRAEEADLLARDAKLLPGDPRPHYARGMLLYLLDDGDAAYEELAEACRLGPNDYRNWLGLALLSEKQERWEEAARAIKRMSELEPEAEDWKGILLRMRQTLEQREREAAAADTPHSESESPAEAAAGEQQPENREAAEPAQEPGEQD
jgi:tetratricopeptide (TPR) repeat protein